MAHSPFTQPYIRTGIHHIIATLLFTLYAVRVSPFIDSIPFTTLFFQTAAFFVLLYLLRFSFYFINSRINILTDISLYTLAGILYAVWHHVFYGFPLESNIKVAFGILLIGSLITIDLAISHARMQQDNPSSFVTAPKAYVPLAVQIGFTVIFFVISLTMTISLIMSNDLLWIAQHEALYLSTDKVTELVNTFLVIAIVFSFYIISITRNATGLLKRQLAYQIQALDKASEKDFDNKVPMNALGELSIIAFYTNNMMYDLTRAEKKAHQVQAPVPKSYNGSQRVYRDDNKMDHTVIHNIAALVATKDGASRAHLMRVQRYVKLIATELAKTDEYKQELSHQSINLLYSAVPLYDIGKIVIPDNILKKPSKLTDTQLTIARTHAQVGADILHAEEDNDFYKMARVLALTHHEWWNGSGYPNQLAKQDIPLVGRILALADVYDALVTKKSYRPAYEHNMAKNIIEKLKEVQFDPDVVDAFLVVEKQFQDVNRRYRNELLYTLIS